MSYIKMLNCEMTAITSHTETALSLFQTKVEFLLVWVIIGGERANNWGCWVDDTNEWQARAHRGVYDRVYDRVSTLADWNTGWAQAIPEDCTMTYILRSAPTTLPHWDLTSCQEMAYNLIPWNTSPAILHLRPVLGMKHFSDLVETMKI